MTSTVLKESEPTLSASKQRSIAITGAASFLGRNLIGLLEEEKNDCRIIAIDVEPPPTAAKKTHFYAIDLIEPGAERRLSEVLSAEGVQTLVHLAFVHSPIHATAWAHELESVGTMRVLAACRSSGVSHVIHRSTTLLYGAHPSNPCFLTEKHPLRASSKIAFFADKIEAEKQALQAQSDSLCVTVLRMAPILGPTVGNFLTQHLARPLVPTMMGFDPLMQFLHEVDAISACRLAVDSLVPGAFNIVSQGVLPLLTVLKLAGRMALPLPHPLAEMALQTAWATHASTAPVWLSHYLRFACVADGSLAEKQLKWRSSFSTREAVSDFAYAQRLRDAKLLDESAPTRHHRAEN